jgi:hypothetical protein
MGGVRGKYRKEGLVLITVVDKIHSNVRSTPIED